MNPAMVEVRGRLRRKRLTFGTIRVATWLAPLIGQHAAVRIANRAALLLRLDMRVGNGKWQRVPLDVPQLKVEP